MSFIANIAGSKAFEFQNIIVIQLLRYLKRLKIEMSKIFLNRT